MKFYVYILECSDGSYYTGHTDNLDKRLNEHQSNKYSGYTSRRQPVRLVFYEELSTRIAALSAERKIKTWSRRKKIALIQGGWQGIINLRVSKNK